MSAINRIKKDGLNDTDKTFIRIAAYSLGSLGLGGFFWWLGKKFYKDYKAKKADKQTLTDNTPENYAKRLQMGFENDGLWGTNVEQVRQVFQEIPSKQVFKEVVSKYKDVTHGKELYADLASELTSSEYYEMQNILAAKPDKTGQPNVFDLKRATAIAKRIKAAFDYTILGMPATDKGALKAALDEIPSQYAFAMVKAEYEIMYSNKIEDDLNSELDIFDFSWKDIIYSKPQR